VKVAEVYRPQRGAASAPRRAPRPGAAVPPRGARPPADGGRRHPPARRSAI